MKKSLILLVLLFVTMFASAQNYLRTNSTFINNGSAFLFDNFNITDRTRIVTHIKVYKKANEDTGSIFGTGGYYLAYKTIMKNGNYVYPLVAKTGEPNGEEHEIGNLEFEKDLYISFKSGNVTIDYEPNALEHKYNVSWDYSSFKKELGNGDRFDFGTGFNTGGFDSYTDMEIYYIKIYQGNVLEHYYIPSKFNGEYCLYDIKTDSFFNETNLTQKFSSNITQCRDHKYVFFKYDNSGLNHNAVCKVCGHTIPAGQWTNKEELGLTAIDPYFNTEALGDYAGEESVILTSMNPMDPNYVVRVFDVEKSRDVYYTTPTDDNFVKVQLPQVDKTTKYNIVARVMQTEMNGTQTDTTYVYAPVQVTQQPYHSFHDLMPKETNVVDGNGIKKQENVTLTFKVDNIKDEDIMASDEFLVMRAFKEDFSDAVTVGSVSLDDNKDGVFTFVDEDLSVDTASVQGTTIVNFDWMDKTFSSGALGAYRDEIMSFYTYPNKTVHYKVARATAQSFWPDQNKKFYDTVSLVQTSMLPPVSNISLKKDKDWEENKIVKLRVELANPYVWEYIGSKDSIVREQIKQALLKGDSSLVYRRYRWDENAKIKIKRYSPSDEYYNGEDYAANTIIVNGSDVKWDASKNCYYAEVEDVQNLPYLHYYYLASVDGSACVKCYSDPMAMPENTSEGDANACYSETAALITSLTADQGTSKGQVCLKWEVGAGDKSYLTLERRTLNEKDGQFKTLEIDQESNSYIDTDVAPGDVYEYRLTSTLKYQNHTYKSDKTCNGWVSFYGSISGKVMMEDGTALAGATVRVSRNGEVVIKTAMDENENVILEGVTGAAGFAVLATTDQNGYFFVDSLLYNSNEAQYEVTPDFGQSSFKPTSMDITLSTKRCIYDDVDFICTTSFKFVGRVLYENSTVPVKGVRFLMSKKNEEMEMKDSIGNENEEMEMKDSRGNAIETDQDGNFAFLVPEALISIRAVKEGHIFLDGEIKNTNGETTFVPDQDYSGLIIYDQTKVRVIGRIAGGNTEGSKALGFGLSKNNLGDDMTMVLQLEGNNTAQIVYKKDNPDDTEINQTVAHTYGGGTTSVSLQKKRIVIKPDPATGEFYADLFPTKYKVTQISAKGYSTLFASGEGFEVIDFTDSVATKTDTLKTNNFVLNYNAKYNRIYHNPVAVTYQQYRYGQKVAFYGEEKINEKNLLGTKFNATIAKTDKAGNVTYTFGYPVFKQGNRYTLLVRAHEDYYYNGDTSTIPQEVSVNGGTLHVKNGLNSSATKDEVYELDENGMRTIVLDAANTNFSLTGEDALKALTMQVELNDYYYSAEPLKAYVIGSRQKGTDALASFDMEKGLIDVIRDPYGATSSAYREAGTTYHWNYDSQKKTTRDLIIQFGGGAGGVTSFGFGVIGLGAMTETQYEATAIGNIDVPLSAKLDKTNGMYEMKLTDRISTSSDIRDVGAMADVYLGYGTRMDIVTQETVSIIDGKTFEMIAEATRTGAVKELASGKDDKGNEYHVVIGDKLASRSGVSEVFAYSQKHILGTLIPDLEKKRDALLLEGTEAEIQAIADTTGIEQYMLLSKDTYEHKMLIPKDRQSDTFVDKVDEYNNAISSWKQLIFDNEKAKVLAQSSGTVQRYSVAGTSVNHTEGASQYYYNKDNVTLPTNVSGGVTGSGGNSGVKNDGSKKNTLDCIMAAGVIVKVSVSYQKNIVETEVKNYYKVESLGSGYTLSTNDNGYMDIDVYSVVADKAIMINNELKKIDSKDVEAAKIHDYVYYVRGGALRNPWYAPDSTLYYNPGTPLGVQTLKIDNPRIYVENPVVSNIPEDQPAVFTIKLTNDSEISDNTQYLNPSAFVLMLDDATNPYGAKLTIDGQPMMTGRTFYIAPGETITKTLTVEHGTGYDYDNIRLIFRDNGVSLFSYATISVHYLPVATPVTLTSPEDKWVMNTLSASDEKGFYIPVKVDGFDVNSEGFDHIELQYKKRSEGESQYVNLCSFYSDSTLYAAANGEKRMLEGGKIDNFKFYGEKDPVEMEYDIRAVSFRKLGTGYVTRTSDVMAGKKDTRCPEVFGLPAPTSAILTYEDLPTLNFSEPIAYNYLDKTSNFQVVGYTNETDILQSSTLQFPGTTKQCAATSIDRNLSNRDFTVDMMIKKDAGKDAPMSLFSHGDEKDFINFYIGTDNSLNAVISGVMFTSGPLELDLSGALTHVGMAYSRETGKVKFFANNTYIGRQDTVTSTVKYSNVGKIYLGTFLDGTHKNPFKGEMLEVRVWSKVLSESEVAAFKGKHLTGYERQLIANWPLTETIGDKANDRVHGADLALRGLSWNNVNGYSLHIDKQPVTLDAMKLQTNKEADNSIEFWFKVDEIDETRASKQNGRVALFKAGADQLGKGQGKMFIGFEKDNFVVNTNDSSFVVGSKEGYAGTGWHHFAMTVNRATNYMAVYLNSKLVCEDEAALVDGLASDYAALGDSAMVGNFDIFAQWDLALPSYYIKDFYNTRLFGTEMGLKNYMPFNYNTTNSQGTQVLAFSIMNEVVKTDADGKVVAHKDTLVTSVLGDINKDIDNHAPVKESPDLQNLDFSWTSTDNALQLNVNEYDSKINKQYIYFTVRGVEDLSGNTMKNPVMWACYVDKNVLRWKEQNIELECDNRGSAQGRIEWKNVSGKRLDYTVDNIPEWLTIDRTSGTATAEKEGYFTITTNKDLAPGKYTETIYLTDENGLSDPLTIDLVVLADETGWVVDKTMYDRTMNLMAKVALKGYSSVGYKVAQECYDDDPQDEVGAFINGECVGVANITVDPTLGAYLMMTIYGDSLIAANSPKKNITFLLWRHDSGVIYELENVLADGTVEPVKFITNSTVGLPPEEPITLRATDKIEQDIYLDAGWNWVSFYVSPRAVDGINSVFINQAGLFSDDDIIKRVDFAQYSEKYKSWLGTLDKTDYHNVYQVFVRNAGTYKMLGYDLPQDSLTVNVNPGWNDMPYLLSEALDINRALADFQIGDKAKNGDIVKSLDEFAVAKEDAETGSCVWIGTLKYLVPGKGYYLKHNGEATSFAYQKNAGFTSAVSQSAKTATHASGQTTAFNMPVIATFDADVDYQAGDRLVAYVNDKKVGETVDKDGIFFLSVNAENNDVVVFAQERDGRVIGKSRSGIRFDEANVVGSLKSPYKVSFKEDADSDFENADIYDINGIKYSKPNQGAGIYIINGKKVLVK